MVYPAASFPAVVIVGAGFGGLRAARGLRQVPVDVTVLDRHNYHTFVPLLYQVATAGLEPEEIAQPVRRILRGVRNARFRLATVTGVGLHTGEAVKEGEDFFGRHVNLAARIAGQAAGGEVLISSLLKELSESADAFVFDQGRKVELKGLTGLHTVFAVAW